MEWKRDRPRASSSGNALTSIEGEEEGRKKDERNEGECSVKVVGVVRFAGEVGDVVDDWIY